jgi:hypothetical protein
VFLSVHGPSLTWIPIGPSSPTSRSRRAFL